MQRLARGYGATLLDRCPVTAVRDRGRSVEVSTADATFRAGRLLLCTDAWTADLLAQLGAGLPLVVTQEQFSYYRPADPDAFAVGRFPVWIWMDDPASTASRSGRGPPSRPPRTLAATRSPPPPAASTPTRPPPTASPGSSAPACRPPPAPTTTPRPASTPSPRTATSPSAPLPGHDRVLVALGAAHGFKFAPLLGRVLADLALHDGTEVDVTPFALDRPALTTPVAEASYLV
jgi:sarcosine oxidase